MKKSLRLAAALFLFTTLFVAGCHKKEDPIEVDNETQSAVDNAIADQEYMAVVPAAQAHAINTKGTGSQRKGVSLPCDTLTLISGDTLWGTSGHVDPTYTMSISRAVCSENLPDGRFRTGKLKLKVTGPLKEAGSKMIILFEDYMAGGISYACDSMVVKTESSNSSFSSYNIRLFKGICKKGSNWTIQYMLNRTIIFYPKGNPAGSDPVTYIYGTATGTNRQGRDFAVTIPAESPLVKFRSCEFISGGLMTLTPSGFAERKIDYGYSVAPAPHDGCDEDASFTVNGNTVAFKLK